MNNEKYSVKMLMKSEKFKNDLDLISALLKKDKEYTISEVEKIIHKYKERRI